ncbi:LysR family transcriptional regulator (plasmid) [Ruegeria sp. AD91A]|uniref:LysR family transcriptional regulator n=1 Tax=Ruegeria sp. AD91A TaxID=2293862 RepID=UPI000E468D4F|nr:LysR family transcriptional regulator [Ruegeria sp. AD91A]AXT29284.1 LysR family transcriptional regulator [Ruegeria sp. AD91A]
MENTLRHLNALRVFEVAARHSSFAKAAVELNVSHSVVSQHIRNLELWFGTELFIRHGNRVELSDDGRDLHPQIASGMQTLTDASEILLRKTRSGTLVVSAEPALASLWLRKRITEFCSQFPRIEIDLRPAWTPAQIGEGQADMIIHFETRIPKRGVERDNLFPIDGYPAATPDVRDALPTEGSAIDWQRAELVHDNGKETWHKWYAAHEPKSEGWRKGRIHSDLSLAIDAAVDGEGVILADDILCQREISSGQLVRLDDRSVRCIWYQIAIPRGTSKSGASAFFRDWLLGQTQNLRE